MSRETITEKLAFVAAEREQEETTLLAQAMRAGIQALYLETITEAFLAGRISREDALAELGAERLAEVDADALSPRAAQDLVYELIALSKEDEP